MVLSYYLFFSFFFNDTATTEIYTLSLHDALPISRTGEGRERAKARGVKMGRRPKLTEHQKREAIRRRDRDGESVRSEEHTSELQSHSDLVCRLLLEKKKKKNKRETNKKKRDYRK